MLSSPRPRLCRRIATNANSKAYVQRTTTNFDVDQRLFLPRTRPAISRCPPMGMRNDGMRRKSRAQSSASPQLGLSQNQKLDAIAIHASCFPQRLEPGNPDTAGIGLSIGT